MEPKRSPGRPKSGRTTVHYNLTLPARLVPLAEMAKEGPGLSAVLAECLEQRYGNADRTADSRAPYNASAQSDADT